MTSLAIENGVRCIEHGNLLDTKSAERMAELWAKAGMPARNLEKNQGVFELGCRSIEVARAAGVELGLGTDLLGEAQPWQNRELAIRSELEPAADCLRPMYSVNADVSSGWSDRRVESRSLR